MIDTSGWDAGASSLAATRGVGCVSANSGASRITTELEEAAAAAPVTEAETRLAACEGNSFPLGTMRGAEGSESAGTGMSKCAIGTTTGEMTS